MEEGYVLIFPGAWGNAPKDYGLAVGLQEADVPAAIEVHDWTSGPFMLLQNLRDLDRNREEAARLAQRIVAYEQRYPGRPVHVIGYSGGGGMAVLTLEALPAETKVTRAILLAPTLAPDYDLQPALRHVEQRIDHFYSPYDVMVLGAAMTVVGTTEGCHTPAAGVAGFCRASTNMADERYRICQHAYTLDMLWDGHPGGHFGWTNPAFVRKHIAPLVQ